VLGDDDDRVSLVRGHPDAPRSIERDPIGPFEERMRHEDVVETERVRGKGGVAADGTSNRSAPAELDLPDRSPGGVGHEQRAILREGKPVRDQMLGTGRVGG
jgi:hypothetical protein